MAEPTYHLDDPDTDIYVGDCREVLAGLLAGSADLVFADPPFNWNFKYNGWRDNLPREDYLEFTRQWLDGSIRMLSPRVNIPDDTAAEVVMHLKERGLEMVNWCIWHFRFGQCRDRNFIVSKVHVLYFARDRRNRIWNPDAVLEASDRASIYNDARTTRTHRPGKRVPLDVWYGRYLGRIQGNNRERRPGHANQIPEAYMERVIRSSSDEGSLVLDPFLGSGTTSTVARSLGRRSIGIEFSAANARSAYERIRRGMLRRDRPDETDSFMTHRIRRARR
jgi:site-specific DNA-methyltransferase (adenine-specific)